MFNNLENMLGTREEFEGSRKRKDILTCELCGRDFQMAHNEDEDNQAEMESIEEHGRCGECYEEYGEDNYPDRI
jgi:hypothetical protein